MFVTKLLRNRPLLLQGQDNLSGEPVAGSSRGSEHWVQSCSDRTSFIKYEHPEYGLVPLCSVPLCVAVYTAGRLRKAGEGFSAACFTRSFYFNNTDESLCQKDNCQRPPLDNGFLVPNLKTYKHNETISYGCETGWKPALETWWGWIKCSHGEWSHTPRCIGE